MFSLMAKAGTPFRSMTSAWCRTLFMCLAAISYCARFRGHTGVPYMSIRDGKKTQIEHELLGLRACGHRPCAHTFFTLAGSKSADRGSTTGAPKVAAA